MAPDDPGNPRTTNADELVDWVDINGVVIEVVTRARMRAEGLRHRATYVVLIDSQQRLVVHKRADWKEVYPGWWDLAFGGVCGAGEDWMASAERELAEEAGVADQPLSALGDLRYEGPDGKVVGKAYVAYYDGPISFNDGEVVAIDRVPLPELGSWMARRNVCLDSKECVVPLLAELTELNQPS